MPSRFRHLRAPLLAAFAAASLSACISLGGDVPPFLLTLDADATPPAGIARTAAAGSALTILVPTAPQKLQTTRIPVQEDDNSVTYIKDAQWVDVPTDLMQQLVSATVAARTNRVVLDESQYLTAPGDQLASQLLEFGVDARTNEAVVVYHAMLVSTEGKTVTQRRFEAREPIIGAVEAKPVGEALTRGANKVAVEIAGWLGG